MSSFLTISSGTFSNFIGGAFVAVLFITAAHIALVGITRKRLVDDKGNQIPHGPIGLPLVGSFPFLTEWPELILDRWAKKYGSLYSMWLGNQLFVIISDPHVKMYVKSELVFAGRGITTTPYNDRWKKHRRLGTMWLSKPAVEKYGHVLDNEAVVFVKDLYRQGKGGLLPINIQEHAARFPLNNMLAITFGAPPIENVADPFVGEAVRLAHEFMNTTGPVSNLIDFIPILQKFPSEMKSRGKKLQSDLIETYGKMLHEVDGRLKRQENVPDCLAKNLLESRQENDSMTWTWLCFTSSVVQWFSALIPAYPEIQARAHEELDRVVGRDRLPTVEDEKNMPYIHAIIKEVERCYNPFWLGTPHVNTQDFTYRGQFIPKDTVVIINTYTMHHDEQRYPDPHRFNPDRYIDDSTLSSQSANLANPLERDHWMFGAGRRICPGMWLAEREVWLAIARMLWAFRLEEVPGEPIDLKSYVGLSGRSPVPFRLKMVPRHENVAKVLGV
ncbi:cytochrome P450 [Gymnopilus junonius]|uniref:Cytochrome P450 n=1 Tax=Gymnopilus junonius TaxID=109634 RepID=A0A9P5TI16_GYMJU|nr:cytochrome P450 [Gymnopilus junonius]